MQMRIDRDFIRDRFPTTGGGRLFQGTGRDGQKVPCGKGRQSQRMEQSAWRLVTPVGKRTYADRD